MLCGSHLSAVRTEGAGREGCHVIVSVALKKKKKAILERRDGSPQEEIVPTAHLLPSFLHPSLLQELS